MILITCPGRFGLVLLTLAVLSSEIISAVPLLAQTSSTGTVVGNVKDASGAIVANAVVQLNSAARGLHLQTTTKSEGTYRFVQIEPGAYDVVVTAPGFNEVLEHVTANVAQSTLVDITLAVGQTSTKVEVSADSAQVSLQTTNTSIGDVIQHEEVASLPTVQRQITQLAYLQPGTTPMIGGAEGSSGGGTIAGGRTDQNSMTLDGIDITDKSEGGYLVPGLIASFPLPVDAIQEFRGVVSNPGEDQNRSGGGAFALTIRRGANPFHGLIYDYYQNAALNANTWTGNYTRNPKPPLISNRFGATLSGPLLHDKTFFFVAYEGYRFPQSTAASKVGISQSFRSGGLKFTDGSGVLRTYNLNRANGPISSQCGSAGNSTCDSRGLGLDPLIQNYFAFYPTANSPTLGDTNNTQGIAGNVRIPVNSDFAVGRIDHNLSDRWHLFAFYLWEQIKQSTTDQLDFNPAVTNGSSLVSTSQLPVKPTVIVSGATGQLSQSLVYDFRFGFNRQGFNFERQTPQTLLPAAGYALQLGAGTSTSLFDQPGNSTVSTLPREAALTEEWQFSNSINWVKGAHLFNGGVDFQHVNMYHYRLTQGGSIAVPVAQITSSFTPVPASSRPPTCSVTVTTFCIRPSDLNAYNQLYATLIGQWDYTTFFNSRDPQGNVVDSLSHPPSYDQTTEHFEFLGGDVWQLKPSLTANYGVNLTYDTPHRDVDGKDYLLVDSNNKLIDPYALLAQRQAAANQGATYTPSIAYVHPAQLSGRATYPAPITFNPRVGLAWNPSFSGQGMNRIFGDRKTVLRGGYALIHDQILGIQTELYGIIGNQLIATTNIITSPTCAAAGTPGSGCVAGAPFRIGTDGQAFTGNPVAFSIPYFPRAANAVTGAAFGVGNGYGLDPNFHPGRYHSFNLTVQRQLPREALVEVGWIGRYGRDLANSANVNAPPITIADMSKKSNQSFAQAYDAVAGQLRSGVTPASVTGQPWFENEFGAGSTNAFASAQSANIAQNNVSAVFTAWIDPQLQLRGLPTVLNRQFQTLTFQTSNGLLNYNAGFISFRKRSQNFSAVINYTFAKCLDTNGRQSDSLNGRLENPYNVRYAYGSCQGETKNVVQSYGRYVLPTPWKSGLSGELTGGWSASYIFTANTGQPIEVIQGNTTGATSSNTAGPSAVLVGAAPKVSRHRNVPNVNGTTSAYNLFANPTDALSHFRYVRLATDTFRSNRGSIFGLGG